MPAVDFELSSDQLALQEAARGLLDDRADHDHVRAHLASGEAYDVALWGLMAEQGWPGVTIPEDRGGVGMTWIEAAVLLEEVGRHAAPVPLLPSLLAGSLLAAADEPPADLVALLARGERLGCVAWSAWPGAVAAARGGGGWTLSGRIGPVEAASVAHVAIVPAGDGVFAVDLETQGRPSTEPAMDGTRTLSWLELEGTPADRLGGADLQQTLLDLGALGTSALMLGGADRVLAMATEYAKERVQFGQPIGSFQAVKHRCADMVVDVEGMRSSTWYAAWSVSADESDASVAVSTAKVWCSDAAKRVTGSGLQVHGGIGFTWEHDLHLYLKRAQFEWGSFGSASFHRQRLGDMLRERVAAGIGVF
jgi:alkylation response protein AidB-like acyl-CoA dehydrogenase